MFYYSGNIIILLRLRIDNLVQVIGGQWGYINLGLSLIGNIGGIPHGQWVVLSHLSIL